MANAEGNLYTMRTSDLSTDEFVLPGPCFNCLMLSSPFLSMDECVLEAEVSKRTACDA